MLLLGRMHIARYAVIAGLLLLPPNSLCTTEVCKEVRLKPLHCVRGTVVDVSGMPVSKAIVTIRRDGTAYAAIKTGEDGEFSFGELKAGRYELQIQADGYRTFQFPILIRKPSGKGKRALEIILTTGYPENCTGVRLVKR